MTPLAAWACRSAAAAILLASPVMARAQVYLRADLGASWARSAGIRDRSDGPACVICSGSTLDDLGRSAALGLGAGYRINDLLRGDVTVTYRGGYRLDAADSQGTAYRADIRSWSVMANGYVDLPVDIAGIRPFVGGGIGWARNRTGGIGQSWPAGALYPAGSESDPAGSRNSFAWQATAGLALPITAGLVAELAYRYADLGRIGTDAGNSTVGYAGGFGYVVPTGGVEGRLKANEVTVSLRYSF